MKKFLLAGFLVLVPLVVLAVLVGKAFDFSLRLTQPVRRFVPLDTIGHIAVANIIAIVGLLLVFLLAGLLARVTRIAGRLDRLDRLVVAAVPSYAVAKVALGAAASGMEGEQSILPVLVRFDDYSQIAFEVERNETYVMLFLPGSPSVFSGASVRVDVERVTRLDMLTRDAAALLQMLGRGTLDVPLIGSKLHPTG